MGKRCMSPVEGFCVYWSLQCREDGRTDSRVDTADYERPLVEQYRNLHSQ